ncbi:hypothetical protein [Runella aurantiaca]|uniref:Uncharacterized protein n=1 Tax=Runella aurantiaca TaxID=2282308 RepID=A0A369I457_9BACT|nr:hypothetical protein [Runella aurantiaca]RDB03832.1 hypothetical protein DVG78_21495 [Runella aurantiaca]
MKKVFIIIVFYFYGMNTFSQTQNLPILNIEIIGSINDVNFEVSYRVNNKVLKKSEIDLNNIFKDGGVIKIANNIKDVPVEFQLITKDGFDTKELSNKINLEFSNTREISFDKEKEFDEKDSILKFSVLKSEIRISKPKLKKLELINLIQEKSNPDTKKNNSVVIKNDCLECDNKNTHLLHYDFSCKQFYKIKNGDKIHITNVRKLGYRQMIQLKIENVNRYIYDISIYGTEVVHESSVPPLLRQLFIGDSTLLNTLINNVSATTQSLKQDEKGKGNELNNKYEKFVDAIDKLSLHYEKLQVERLKAFELCGNFSCCNVDNIGITFGEILFSLRNINMTLYDLKMAIAKDDGINKLKADLSENLNKVAACKKIENEILSLGKQIDILKKKEKLTDPEKKELDDLTTKKDKLKVCTPEDVAVFNQQVQNLKDLLAPYSNIDSLQKYIPSKLQLEKLFLFVQNIRKSQSYYLSPPIFQSGNRIELAIKISPNSKSLTSEWSTISHDNDSLNLSIPMLWKPFVSFSSGSFLSLGKHLQNKTYAWQSVPNGSNQVDSLNNFILAEKGYSTPVMGFAALVNVEFKLLPSFGLGASAGVGLTIEKVPRMSYLAGFSAFFGDMHQLVITGGIAGMQIDQLTNNLQAVHNLNTIYKSKVDIEYYKEFKVGGFFAITYTPFKKSRKLVSKSITQK